MADHQIRPGQVYTDCDPRGGATIRITAHTPNSNRADVVDATTGKRPRTVLATRLHASGITNAGNLRLSGYRLVTILGEVTE